MSPAGTLPIQKIPTKTDSTVVADGASGEIRSARNPVKIQAIAAIGAAASPASAGPA